LAKKYLDSDGLLYLWQKIKNLFATKTDAVKNITRSGTTYTVTRADGTTFTFDQKDYLPANTAPLMDGTAAIGTSEKYAREDHVHPSDSSKVDVSLIGAANGVCPLDSTSKINSSYLPSYVDDVIEVYPRTGATVLSSSWFSETGVDGAALTPESGVLYVLLIDSGEYAANTQFRWGSTQYVKLNDGGVTSITNAEIDTIVAT